MIDAAPTPGPGTIEVVEAYVAHLPLDDTRRARLVAQVEAQAPAGGDEAMRYLHAALAQSDAVDAGAGARGVEGPGDAVAASIAARIGSAFAGLTPWGKSPAYRGASMPPLERWPMSPSDVDRRPWRFLDRILPRRRRRGRTLSRPVPSQLRGVVRLRQCLLALLVVLPGAGATAYMATVLPHRGTTLLEIFILASAFCLFAWILVGFWTAVFGFFVLSRGDRYRVRGSPPAADDPDPPRTAIVMPIYEEDVSRTFAGLQAVYESLAATGRLESFDFFVLSDSVKPDTIVAEQQAWANTCRALDGFGRLYYRRRRARVKRKSGNLADFCRRWGGAYRYMIVLDADSIMTGDTLTQLVDRMQANPNVGLIQTPPVAVNRDSMLARVQQFATKVYGRMFAAGLHYWHLDNAHYWGHNAIIRIAPFMAHCALPRLPGRGALSGEIMSHDFVEAALMRRAGWGVFIAYDLGGSYEEVPPTLLDELGRDRRWCQGNIQHLRLLFSDNLAPAHRALFANGVMAYTSAAIWFVFLLLSSTEAVMEALRTPDYFPEAGSLFPEWPVWEPIWAISLFVATAVVLFLPKILGVMLLVRRGAQRDYGGTGRLIGSTLIEIGLTTLLAPIRMLSHTRFVVTTIVGAQVKWNAQQRADVQVPWLRALRFHLPGMLLAAAWGALLLKVTPGFAAWLAPILIPLLIAPAVTVISSRVDAGMWLRKRSLQLIPEEVDAPDELRRVIAIESASGAEATFADAIIDPVINALHVGLQGGPRRLDPALAAYREQLAEQVFEEGPDALDEVEKRRLLADPQQMLRLHARVWSDQPTAWQSRLAAPVGAAAAS